MNNHKNHPKQEKKDTMKNRKRKYVTNQHESEKFKNENIISSPVFACEIQRRDLPKSETRIWIQKTCQKSTDDEEKKRTRKERSETETKSKKATKLTRTTTLCDLI
jgi:hypothetical protein